MTNNTSMLLKAATAQYNTEYLKRLQKMIDAIYTKKEGANARNNKLKNQKALNYQMESDRINGILANSLLSQTHPNYTRLKNKAKELEELGALAFNRKIPE